MSKRKFVSTSILALVLAVTLSGCVGYYGQAIHGQLHIWHSEKPIKDLVAAPKTDPKLKNKLELVLSLRDYAEKNLSLHPDGHYLLYADLHREHVVWNVHAAPELSQVAKSWWYPFVGRATYRGYFSEKAADKYAAKLARQGLDVYTEGVDAYSTLGFFKDPVLNTFVYDSDVDLAETIFHELSHQRVYVGGDTDFNEAFAVSVEQEGVKRWLESTHNTEAFWQKFQARHERRRIFLNLVFKTREKLKAIYNDPNLSDQEKRKRKAAAISELRENYEAAKKAWGGYRGYDEWFAGPLNNAQLDTISTYYDLVPAFTKMIELNGGDLSKYYNAVEELTKLSKEERHAKLKQLLAPQQTAAK